MHLQLAARVILQIAPLLIVDLDCDKQKKAENAFDVFKHRDDTHDMKLHEAFKEIFAACLSMVAIDDSSNEMSLKVFIFTLTYLCVSISSRRALFALATYLSLLPHLQTEHASR